jgi:hypothetical protein
MPTSARSVQSTQGSNTYGQVGDGTTATRASPSLVSYEGWWLQVATGDYHACGIRSDFSAWCWVRMLLLLRFGRSVDPWQGQGQVQGAESLRWPRRMLTRGTPPFPSCDLGLQQQGSARRRHTHQPPSSHGRDCRQRVGECHCWDHSVVRHHLCRNALLLGRKRRPARRRHGYGQECSNTARFGVHLDFPGSGQRSHVRHPGPSPGAGRSGRCPTCAAPPHGPHLLGYQQPGPLGR